MQEFLDPYDFLGHSNLFGSKILFNPDTRLKGVKTFRLANETNLLTHWCPAMENIVKPFKTRTLN